MPSSPKRVRSAVCRSPAAAHPRSDTSQHLQEFNHETFQFPFSQLPDEALQRICTLGSTRSCPAPCRLALTSKGCSEAVTEHVRDALIELQLGLSRTTTAAALATPPKTNILQLTPAPNPTYGWGVAAAPPTKQQQEAADLAARMQADCARLFSLSTWLKKNSNQVGSLTITSNSKYASGLDYWQRGLLATGMAAVMQGLAAGRAAQGRLRLTAVDLEVGWGVCSRNDALHRIQARQQHAVPCSMCSIPVACCHTHRYVFSHFIKPVCLHALLLPSLQVLSHSQLQATLDTLSACQRLRRLRLFGPIKLHRWANAMSPGCSPCPADSDVALALAMSFIVGARTVHCWPTGRRQLGPVARRLHQQPWCTMLGSPTVAAAHSSWGCLCLACLR
jgi:hypothetical protein